MTTMTVLRDWRMKSAISLWLPAFRAQPRDEIHDLNHFCKPRDFHDAISHATLAERVRMPPRFGVVLTIAAAVIRTMRFPTELGRSSGRRCNGFEKL